MQSMNIALVGARANPFDISGRPQASSSSSSSSGSSSSVSTAGIPKMQAGQQQILASRTALIQEIQGKKSTLTRPNLAADLNTAQTAIANLTPKGQEVLKALLLNIVRDAALTHRIEHSENITEVTSGVGQVATARSKQAVPVGTLDRAQQAAILQKVLHQAPTAQFSVEWGQVALRQVHPTHLSTIFVEMGSQHTYKDIFESLKDMKQSLNVPLHVLVHAASQPSEEGVENAFKAALGGNFNPENPVQSSALKRLKAVSFLMHVLEPARDPVVGVTNILADHLLQKGTVSSRHFIHPHGKLGVLTPVGISDDNNRPTLTYKHNGDVRDVPIIGRNLFKRTDLKAKQDGQFLETDLARRTSALVKADRTYAVIEAVLAAAQGEGSRPFHEQDGVFANLAGRVMLLARGLTGSESELTEAAAGLKKVLIRDVLAAHFQPGLSELVAQELAKEAPNFETVQQHFTQALGEGKLSQAVKIVELSQKHAQARGEEAAQAAAPGLIGMAQKIAAGNPIKGAEAYKMLGQIDAVIALATDPSTTPQDKLEIAKLMASQTPPDASETIANRLLQAGQHSLAAQAFVAIGAIDRAIEIGRNLATPGEAIEIGHFLVSVNKADAAAEIAHDLINKEQTLAAYDLARVLAKQEETVPHLTQIARHLIDRGAISAVTGLAHELITHRIGLGSVEEIADRLIEKGRGDGSDVAIQEAVKVVSELLKANAPAELVANLAARAFYATAEIATQGFNQAKPNEKAIFNAVANIGVKLAQIDIQLCQRILDTQEAQSPGLKTKQLAVKAQILAVSGHVDAFSRVYNQLNPRYLVPDEYSAKQRILREAFGMNRVQTIQHILGSEANPIIRGLLEEVIIENYHDRKDILDQLGLGQHATEGTLAAKKPRKD